MGAFEVERDLRANWLPSLSGGALGVGEVEFLLTEYSILKATSLDTVPQPGRFVACEGPLGLLVARDLPALRRAHLIELRSARKRQGKLNAFRLTQAGIRAAEGLWRELEKKAEAWLAGVPVAERNTHLEVNGRIQSRLRPAWKRLLATS
jgi:post-segregation antitoxin (ccd killing protein)